MSRFKKQTAGQTEEGLNRKARRKMAKLEKQRRTKERLEKQGK